VGAARLSGLKAAYSDTTGVTWSRRLKRADTRHKRYSRDWKPLRRLYVETQESRRRWGVDVNLGRTIVDGIVADSYVRNPDPVIESQNAHLSADDEMRLRNLFRTLHEDCDTKTILQRGRVYAACYGFAGHWTDYDTEWHEESGVEAEYATEVENAKARPTRILDNVRLRGQLVSPWDLRFDPNCRNWDLSDAGWVARLYSPTLKSILDDDTGAYTEAGKQRLRRWCEGQTARRARADGVASLEETDPAHRVVDIWEVWSRADGWKVYQIPYNSEICVGEYDAPPCWRDSDTYPLTLIAMPLAWNPADEDGDGDFYPSPDLRKIRSPLENLPRLEAAFLDSVTNSARKYFGVAGMFQGKELTALQTDENRVFIPVELKALLKELLGGESVSVDALLQFDVRRWLSALPNPEGGEAIKHLEAIQHQLDLCFMLSGRGPMDRGGIPKTESATSSLGIQERLATWRDMTVEAMADIADQISDKFFKVLKKIGTVPMRYRIVADNVTTFDTFDLSDLKDMHLVFRHHVGSSRPATREVRQAARERIFGLAAPVLAQLGDTPALRDMLSYLIELEDSIRANKIIDPRLQEMASRILIEIDRFRNDQTPLSVEAANALLELISAFLNAYLPPGRIQQAAAESVRAINNQATPPAEQRSGSMAKAPSMGSAAAAAGGLGAAGAIGGMTRSAA